MMSQTQNQAGKVLGKIFIDPEFLKEISELLPRGHKFIELLSGGDVLIVYSCLYHLSESVTLSRKQVLFLKKLFEEEEIHGENNERKADELYLLVLACVRAHAFRVEMDKNFFYHC